jgi:HlyD family secretion protein
MSIRLTHCKQTLARPLILMGIVALLYGCRSSEDPNQLSASGTIEATEIHVASKQPGEIVSMLVDDGSAVKAGDLIAVLDHAALDAQLREADAAAGAAGAQLQLTKKGARNEDIAQAQLSLDQARSNRELAAKELERARNLVAGNAMTREQFDNTENRFRLAQAQFEQATQQTEKVRHLARPEEVSAASSRLEQLEASRERIRTMISDAYVTAPVSGIIERRVLQQGEVAPAGATIATLIDPSTVHLELYIPEMSLARVAVGQMVDVTLDGSAKIYHGKIVYISPQAEFTPKNIQTKDDRTKLVFAAKVDIPNPTGELKAGIPADASIHLK